MKVLKPFRDKKNKLKRYNKGDDYKSDSKDRIAELQEKGYLEKPKEKPKAKAKAKTNTTSKKK